jgi:hypothetical protein
MSPGRVSFFTAFCFSPMPSLEQIKQANPEFFSKRTTSFFRTKRFTKPGTHTIVAHNHGPEGISKVHYSVDHQTLELVISHREPIKPYRTRKARQAAHLQA